MHKSTIAHPRSTNYWPLLYFKHGLHGCCPWIKVFDEGNFHHVLVKLEVKGEFKAVQEQETNAADSQKSIIRLSYFSFEMPLAKIL